MQLAWLIGVTSLAGCASLLPHGEVEIATQFASFEEARDTIEALKPFYSSRQRLAELGIDPAKQPNITILTYTDILHHFVAGSAIERKDLDPGITACFDAREKCTGWEIVVSKISKKRSGNALLDITNFRRRTPSFCSLVTRSSIALQAASHAWMKSKPPKIRLARCKALACQTCGAEPKVTVTQNP
jgi:hypothetical protein